MATAILTRYSEDQPRAPAGESDGGQFAGTGGGSGTSSAEKPASAPASSAKLSDRAQRALATYKPSNKEKQDAATKAEQQVARMVNGATTPDNDPVDVTVPKGAKTVGIEVKSLQDNGNNKITMHPASLQRKEAWARKRGREIYTVVVDERVGKIYARKGVGSFRLKTLTPMKDKAALMRFLGLSK